MNGSVRAGLALILALAAMVAATPGRSLGQEVPRAEGGRVHVIPIVGTIDEGLAGFVERAVHAAEDEAAAAILIEINTFGGRVDSATRIIDVLQETEVPVLAFIKERAWSAGALIALAAEKIAMAPAASIGAAEPRPAEEKVISALRAQFEAMAERHGRDPRIAAAMVDARIEIEGVVRSDEILTLSAAKARSLGFIDLVAQRRSEVLANFGLGDLRVVEPRPNWAEGVARFLTDPYVSSLLLTLGFLGLLAEVTSPGWGVPGTAGLVALALFFGGRFLTGLAGLEALLLFFGGLALLALEIFLIPGFGIAGLSGVAAIVASIFISFPEPGAAINVLAGSLAATVLVGLILIRFRPRTGAWERIVLSTRLEEAERREREAEIEIRSGQIARAVTVLRPAGTIELDGNLVDAVSEGGFIAAGAAVRVVRLDGRRVVVREVRD